VSIAHGIGTGKREPAPVLRLHLIQSPDRSAVPGMSEFARPKSVEQLATPSGPQKIDVVDECL
jgi:hypothetical protein